MGVVQIGTVRRERGAGRKGKKKEIKKENGSKKCKQNFCKLGGKEGLKGGEERRLRQTNN